MAHRVDRATEYQVLHRMVAVSAHHQQIGTHLLGVADNLAAWIGRVADGGFDRDAVVLQAINQSVEITLVRLALSPNRRS